MANLIRNLSKVQQEHRLLTNFRYLLRPDALTDKELDERGFYKGYPCSRGHVIRDKQEHWCYHCCVQLMQNICGLDINYIHPDYRGKLQAILSKVKVGEPDQCWEWQGKTSYVHMPSYRSAWALQRADKVQAAKAVYTAFWGDIGTYRVDRICGNKKCCNPLHLVSTWNQRMPPQRIHPFDLELSPEKLMLQLNLEQRGYNAEKLVQQFRSTITNPLEAAPDPDYHEP